MLKMPNNGYNQWPIMAFIMQPQFKLVRYTSNWVFNSGTKGLSITKMQHRVKSHYWQLQRITIYQQETQHQTGWCSNKTLRLVFRCLIQMPVMSQAILVGISRDIPHFFHINFMTVPGLDNHSLPNPFQLICFQQQGNKTPQSQQCLY